MRSTIHQPGQGHCLSVHRSSRSICRKFILLCLVIWAIPWIPSLEAQKKISNGVIVRELELHKEILSLLEDHDGFIWVGTNGGLFRYDGHEFIAYTPDTAVVHLDGSVSVKSLVEDPLGRIWVSTLQDVVVLSRDRKQVTPLSSLITETQGLKNVGNIVMMGQEAWLFNLTSSITCFRWDEEGHIRQSRTIQTPSYATANVVKLQDGSYIFELLLRNSYLHLSADGLSMKEFAAPADNAIFLRDTLTQTLYAIGPPYIFTYTPSTSSFETKLSFEASIIKPLPCWATMSNHSPGNFWISTKLGHVLYYTTASNTYLDMTDVLSNRLFDGRFFTNNTGIEDRRGGLWLGTNLGLAYIKLQDAQYFKTLPLPQTRPARQSFSTRGIMKDRNGDMWISSYAGLFRYHNGLPAKEYLIWNDVLGEYVDPVVYSFLATDAYILMLSEGNGLLRYEYATDSIYRSQPSSYFYNTNDKEIKALQWGFELFRDHSGAIWMGMMAGLFRMSDNGEIRRDPKLSALGREAGRIYDIAEDTSHTLWVATASGLYSITSSRDSITHHTLGLVEEPKTQCILLDDSPWMWIGTKGNGLIRYDASSGTALYITTEQGLADNTVCNLMHGDDGALWISTNQGLSRYEPDQHMFSNFYMEDGLAENEFNQASAFKDTDGTLYFGSVNGVITFHPEQNLMLRPPSKLRITRINVHDGKAGMTRNYLYNSYLSPSIRLNYTDKYFTVYFSQNDPTPYSKESYAYRLSGLDDHWQIIGQQNSLQFTGLQPGRYTLQIKTLHHQEGDAAMVEIPVYIARPFFKTWFAYLLYVLSIGGIAFLIVREYFKRQHIHRQLQLEMDHKSRLQEINRSKSTFFTNITHEFKTPLTLIQGPAEEIIRRSSDPVVKKQAGLISRSAKSILALVNQLLELGKLEANLEEPQFHRLDLIHHIRQWMQKFEPLARQKDIQLTLDAETPVLYVDFDPVKLETVINNLLSNAVKFTQEKGNVKCAVLHGDRENVLIRVEDNGPGIPLEEQNHIFDRFYQGKNSVLGGTGIGLAFVREMVRIHGGTATLYSVPGAGATFTVSIPFSQGLDPAPSMPAAEVTEEVEEFYLQEDGLTPEQEKALILVVEDHEDVAELIRTRLSADHRILHAPNGREGHAIALAQIPDLIITDVMMPVMDGYSLTHLLKQDLNTSHIPVIMLTARDGVHARIEGRSSGADVYLEKPFSPKELQLTVRNLLALRAALTGKNAEQLRQNAAAVRFETDTDNQFYQSFLHILEERINESDLSVEDFTQRLGISRTQLHRKLKALTGLSVNQVVRNVRLQKGLALIRQGQRTIAEVAYEVGFSSPAYFTERFKEYYGHPPSEVEKIERP